ncbi:MAG: hypothetical protein Gaeavirus17_1 [Gaeavirus sp.]|uniref:Uncharacterized protein n=1 Tax=Gaeavirus sp. TaxID=2487767 RepID=A0A3G4ZZ57_9VIRU|nr:MAG: hypothetical protein Gaeavirus17_1 [Gaeavirus sp.]
MDIGNLSITDLENLVELSNSLKHMKIPGYPVFKSLNKTEIVFENENGTNKKIISLCDLKEMRDKVHDDQRNKSDDDLRNQSSDRPTLDGSIFESVRSSSSVAPSLNTDSSVPDLKIPISDTDDNKPNLQSGGSRIYSDTSVLSYNVRGGGSRNYSDTSVLNSLTYVAQAGGAFSETSDMPNNVVTPSKSNLQLIRQQIRELDVMSDVAGNVFHKGGGTTSNNRLSYFRTQMGINSSSSDICE